MLKRLIITIFALTALAGCMSMKERYSHIPNKIESFESLGSDRVFFDLNCSKIPDEAISVLERQAMWLKENEEFTITVEGHCDQRGTRAYNLALGERRAESIKNFLSSHGIYENRINTISYGKERPAVIGNDEMSWAKNRRGVVSIK